MGTLPAVAQTPVTPQVPLTVWDTTPSMQFDGMSTWLATFADPTAGPGQSEPAYTYFHEFGFVDSNSFGQISLDVIGDEKIASLNIVDAEEGREHRVRVPFAWTGNSFYFCGCRASPTACGAPGPTTTPRANGRSSAPSPFRPGWPSSARPARPAWPGLARTSEAATPTLRRS